MSDEKKVSQVLEQAWESMRKAVPASANAQSYFKERVWNYKLLKAGYSSKNITQLFKKEDHELLLEIGLLKKYNQHTNSSPLKDSIVFPLSDEKGNIQGFYGRKLKDEFNKHIFIREGNGVYPEWPIAETEKLILATSISDTASLLQLDFIRNEYSILAIHGFEGVKDIHKEAILSLANLSQVIIVSPEPIKQDSIAEIVKSLKPEIRIDTVDLPIGEDIAGLLQKGETEKIKALFQFPEKELKKAEIKKESEKTTEKFLPKGEFNTDNPLELIYKTENAIYRILGGFSDNPNSMNVTFCIHHIEQEYKCYRNRKDFYSDDEIRKEAVKAGAKTGIDSFILETELTYLSSLLEKYRKEKGKTNIKIKVKPQLTESTIAEAKSFLSRKGMFDEIDKIIEECGVVGEGNSRMLVFAIASSYKMPNPLHGIIVGDSSSGKTTLMNVIADMMPLEDRQSFTRITENSLYNLDEYELDKKLLTIEDRTGLEDKAEYALRELQSKGELRSLVTVKNEIGEYGTRFKTVRARMATLSCSPSAILITDNENRCYMILVQQSDAQTKLITEYQSKLFAGQIDVEKQNKQKALMQNCIRVLQPIEVVNPFAGKISLPEKVKNKRRLNQLYLSLVSQITLLHQFQRSKDSQGRLIAEIEDLELANKILFDAITMKSDSLEGAILRDFFERLKKFIPDNKSFTARQIYEGLNLSKSKVCDHLNQLTEAECLQKSGSPNRGFEYTISHRDDYEKLKEEITLHFQKQIDELEK